MAISQYHVRPPGNQPVTYAPSPEELAEAFQRAVRRGRPDLARRLHRDLVKHGWPVEIVDPTSGVEVGR
jgi:hypothetical protein